MRHEIEIKKQILILIDNYLSSLQRAINLLSKSDVANVVEEIMNAYQRDSQIFIIGNGGSASTASHFACDLCKGTLQQIHNEKEKRFRAISLSDNVALISALANDLSFDEIFIQQLRNLVKKEDLVIAISCSGNSPNIIKAVEYAKQFGAKTIGFLGFKDGGKLAGIVDQAIIVQSDNYGQIEDVHLVLEHLISSSIAKLKGYYDRNNSKRG
jgi:D-sedoheptulose 7-phosphate isomerase